MNTDDFKEKTFITTLDYASVVITLKMTGLWQRYEPSPSVFSGYAGSVGYTFVEEETWKRIFKETCTVKDVFKYDGLDEADILISHNMEVTRVPGDAFCLLFTEVNNEEV